MKKILNFICFLMIAALICVDSAYAISWVYKYDAALKKAKEENKIIMVDFYTNWCGWCKKLDKSTYKNKKILTLSKNFVCLKLDGSKNKNLVKKYKVKGYPSIYFIDPNEKIIKHISGYVPAKILMPVMNEVLKQNMVVERVNRKYREEKTKQPEQEPEKQSGFSLSGILYDEANPVAIINNDIVRVGDVIQGATVVKITQTTVVIKDKDQTITLTNQ